MTIANPARVTGTQGRRPQGEPRRTAVKDPRSVIAWEGPSEFTGRPIVLALTGLRGESQNEKTGPMAHAWVLPAGENASKAFGSPVEQDVCGACRNTGAGARRPCYVAMGVRFVEQWRAGYPRVELLKAAKALAYPLRVTAYGDPAAVPLEVWEPLLRYAPGWTGYTHAWRSCDPGFKRYLMASVDSREEAIEANRAGWRYFRVNAPGGQVIPDVEVLCPAESRGRSCVQCRLCVGRTRRARNVFITVHGKGAAEWLRRHPQEV